MLTLDNKLLFSGVWPANIALLMDKLSTKEKRFCREYVANGGNGAAAAVAAGYPAAGARVAATRLLKRPRVTAEIDRLLLEQAKKSKPNALSTDVVMVEAPLDGEIMNPPDDDDAALSRDLRREWRVARLMRVVQMCMGEIPRNTVKFTTRVEPAKTAADGTVIEPQRTVVSAIVIKALVHDPAGAIAALAQLAPEVDHLEGRLPPDRRGADQLPGRQMFEEAMKLYARAAQAHAPAANGAAKPNGANGHG